MVYVGEPLGYYRPGMLEAIAALPPLPMTKRRNVAGYSRTYR
jgi:hypothetical protein